MYSSSSNRGWSLMSPNANGHPCPYNRCARWQSIASSPHTFNTGTSSKNQFPVVSQLFMEDFKQTELMLANKWLKLCFDMWMTLRWLATWKHMGTQLTTFLKHLNGLCKKIQFTIEIEEKNRLPFLDVLVQRMMTTWPHQCTWRRSL